MLGNDIVDLRDADSRPESYRSRFDARVYADPERRAIARDPRPLVRRWAHWAAKEAAYKLARQLDSGFVFAPKRLVACFEPPTPGAATGRRRVRCGRLALPTVAGVAGIEVELKSFETPERVHVIALPLGADWEAVESAVVELREAGADSNAEDASRAVRRLARRELGRSLAVPEARLSIGRRGRIPVLELDGEATSLALSLSHHGRWIAYAMTPASGPAMTPAMTPPTTLRVDESSPWIESVRPSSSGKTEAGSGNENGNGPGATNWQTF